MAIGKSIAIVGGGIIGLCTAWYASQRGHRVTVIDRGACGHEGCSTGNAGMIVPSHFIPLAAPGAVRTALRMMLNPESPFYIRPRASWELISWGWKFMKAAKAAHVSRSAPLLRDLHLGSRACYEELAGLSDNDFGLVKRGLLMLCRTEHALEEEAHAAQMALEPGIPAEVLDARQVAELEPGVRMDIRGAVYFPKDCHLSPDRLMTALRHRAESTGVRFFWNTAVRGWRTDDGAIRTVRTDGGEIEADEFVICGGAWSPTIARDLRLRLPMQAGKGYSLTVARPRQLPAICSILTEARVAVTPMSGSLRFGGTMEIAGMDTGINPRRVKGIVQSVPLYFPDFREGDFKDIPVWSGLRPCSPDGLPYIGRTRSYRNLSIATGHAMMGLSLGPITGKLMAEVLSDQRPSIDLTLLSPDRYA